MLRVGIYNEPSGGALGGCESSIAHLAHAATAQGHSVEIVHHQRWLEPTALEAFAATSLDGVSFRYVGSRPATWGASWFPARRIHQAKQAGREVSAGYDVFFAFVHGVPPFNHSPRGVLSVLFPMVTMVGPRTAGRSMRRRASAAYTGWEWGRRLSTYDTLTANSHYTASWCRTRWGVQPGVLYPPVDVDCAVAPKTRSVVSVGRFTRRGHAKRQDALLRAFQDLLPRLDVPASLVALGSLSSEPDDAAYFSELHSAATGLPVWLEPNAPRHGIVGALAAGMVYWHAAGLGQSDDSHPERMEHFGISTVEAMAAGCVPVVIERGGQPEIVEHGVSGYLWTEPRELVEYTRLLLNDPGRRERMAAAARERARRFSIERFAWEAGALIAPGEKSLAPASAVTEPRL